MSLHAISGKDLIAGNIPPSIKQGDSIQVNKPSTGNRGYQAGSAALAVSAVALAVLLFVPHANNLNVLLTYGAVTSGGIGLTSIGANKGLKIYRDHKWKSWRNI
jgi:hypothetical protein